MNQGALFKLTQTHFIADYQSQFEQLSNRVYGLSAQALLSCFISGLKPEIRREIQALQPQTLAQAIGLAKLQEDKIRDKPIPNRSWGHKQPHFSFNSDKPPLLPLPSVSPTQQSSSSLPIKKLPSQEMQLRREKGLCFNCDDKFHPGLNVKQNSLCCFQRKRNFSIRMDSKKTLQ